MNSTPRKPVYLDYNATTPIAPEVAEAMRPFLTEGFGNPSSTHWYGLRAREAVEAARAQVASLLGCDADEILFTSGGSESNNLAIAGAAQAARGARRDRDHIVTTAVEHPAVSEVCRHLETMGFRVTVVPVDDTGLVDPADVRAALTDRTALVTVMHANNEVGTIQPVAEIAAIARERGALVHTDAAQTPGKIPVNVRALGVDLLSIAGHKLYAPKGVGALYVRRGVALQKQIHGADHERNLRAGTESVLLIAGLGAACALAACDVDGTAAKMRALRDRLHDGLSKTIDGLRLNGHPEKRLPNTLNVSLPGIEAGTLLAELDGIAASAGAACHSDSVDVSPVLEAMGLGVDEAVGAIRLSTGRGTTEADVDSAVEAIAAAWTRLHGSAPDRSAGGAAAGDGSDVRLTRYTHGLGCACKLRPQALEQVLKNLPAVTDPAVLVGADTSDDAAVYRIDEQTAVVQTLDFFTPVVDRPEDFGAIAAANALSDVYAMGARPVFALSIVGFPTNRLPLDVLQRILAGAAEVAQEAGISIVGGHSVDDTEPKYGMAVTGLVHPDRILRNAGARPGDALVLTKPIGTGIVATAIKRGQAPAGAAAAAIATMRALNRDAAALLWEHDVHAVTDVTGFGLLGHLKEMAAASGADVTVNAGAVPLIEGARALASAGAVPGGTTDNLEFVSSVTTWDDAVPRDLRLLLCDAQTSGGLLVALPADKAEGFVQAVREGGGPATASAAVIGAFTAGPGQIAVAP